MSECKWCGYEYIDCRCDDIPYEHDVEEPTHWTEEDIDVG